MSEFRIGQQVTWDDYLWDVADPGDNPEMDTNKHVYLWDGGHEHHWAPIEDVEEY